MSVEHRNAAAEGPLSEHSLRRKPEARVYAVSRYVYPPGTRFPPHTHGIDRIDAVVCGRFWMTMDQVDTVLEASDCLAVPRGAIHST